MTVDYDNLSYETFKKLAKDPGINQHERVGFPASFREQKVDFIFDDIINKLSNLKSKNLRFLEVGPGWSELTKKILDFCETQNHEVVFIDSEEMLNLIPASPNLTKVAGKFPDEINDIDKLGKFDAILSYSVLQYIFTESNIFKFMDVLASLLNSQGQLLIGDIPNISMKKRFLASQTAYSYHKQHYQDKPFPTPEFNVSEIGHIDDSVLIGIMLRLRASGYHAFLTPQMSELPMANRREDMVVIKP